MEAVEEVNDDAWERSRQVKRYPDEQMVVRIGWLSHPINHGYNGGMSERIAKCNGVKVRVCVCVCVRARARVCVCVCV